MENSELLQALSDMMDKKFDEKLQPINNRLDKIESEVSALKVGQREIKDKVTDTYNLALEAWSKITENRTWLEKSKLTF